jgi:hypothetical protein
LIFCQPPSARIAAMPVPIDHLGDAYHLGRHRRRRQVIDGPISIDTAMRPIILPLPA